MSESTHDLQLVILFRCCAHSQVVNFGKMFVYTLCIPLYTKSDVCKQCTSISDAAVDKSKQILFLSFDLDLYCPVRNVDVDTLFIKVEIEVYFMERAQLNVSNRGLEREKSEVWQF